MLKKRIVIKGERVQDVGYRLFLLEAAESFGLKGFQARNVEDHVEFLVEGEDGRVAEFMDFAKKNYPELARVENVVEEDYGGSVMSIEGFYRSLSLNQLVKIVNIGSNMLGKQDQTLGKQDQMLERQDKMLEKQDSMLQKQDKMLEKQDKMLGKMDQMLEKQDQMLGKQDSMLEKQDKILYKQDLMLEKQDKMLEKQDVLITEVKSLRSDLKNYMEERFQKIELEITKIKKKIGIK
ncbi:MAG: acylphosphatase [Thermoproteota archaeon]